MTAVYILQRAVLFSDILNYIIINVKIQICEVKGFVYFNTSLPCFIWILYCMLEISGAWL